MGNGMLDNIVKIVNQDPDRYEKLGITEHSLRSGLLTNIQNAAVKDVWFKSTMLNFLQMFYQKEQCEPCDLYRVVCQGICPAMALHDYGDLRKGDKGCFIDLIN